MHIILLLAFVSIVNIYTYVNNIFTMCLKHTLTLAPSKPAHPLVCATVLSVCDYLGFVVPSVFPSSVMVSSVHAVRLCACSMWSSGLCELLLRRCVPPTSSNLWSLFYGFWFAPFSYLVVGSPPFALLLATPGFQHFGTPAL